jgi:hypothetical protein
MVSSVEPSLDRDALDALAWMESGMPDTKVGYGPDAPKLTTEKLGTFKPAAHVRASEVAKTHRLTTKGN